MRISAIILIILLCLRLMPQIHMQYSPSEYQVAMPADMATDEETLRRVDAFDTANCFKRSSYGSCKGWHKMWYFNKWIKRCLTFIYSNCGGNDNRFYTKTECNQKCFYKLKYRPNMRHRYN